MLINESVSVLCVERLQIKVLEKHVKFASNRFVLIVNSLYASSATINHKIKKIILNRINVTH